MEGAGGDAPAETAPESVREERSAEGEGETPARKRPARRRRPGRSPRRREQPPAEAERSETPGAEPSAAEEPIAASIKQPREEQPSDRPRRTPREERRPSRRRPQRRPQDDRRQPREARRPREATPIAKPVTHFSEADRECDLVFGEPSAGIYAHAAAMLELATSYRFRGIAGCGFGAIGAALAAAAEKGRETPGGGFEALMEISRWMAAGESGQPAHLAALLGPASPAELVSAGVKSSGFPWKAAVGSLLGFGLAGVSLAAPAIAPGLVIGGAALAAAGFVLENLNGGTGMATTRVKESGIFGAPRGRELTDWLCGTLNRLAGMKEGGRPLTFGDLAALDAPEEARIAPQFIAADISNGLPLNFPFAAEGEVSADELYYVRIPDLEEYFPRPVVEWMEKAARRGGQFRRHEGFLPLPLDDDLPVVFAVRLACAVFPHLAPFPLYRPGIDGDGWRLRRCWIAGGAAAGAHVDLFDQPLPNRPTFAFIVTAEGISTDKSGLWTQEREREEAPDLWRAVEDTAAFEAAVRATGREWRDRQELRTPGYRERIALVFAPAAALENPAAIDAATAAVLQQRGARAGARLTARFTDDNFRPGMLSWDAHRWIRYRASMALLERHLQTLRRNYYDTADGDTSYDRLVLRKSEEGPDSYRWKDFAQRNHALRVTAQLLDLIERWEKDKLSFGTGDMPIPSPRLRITPRD